MVRDGVLHDGVSINHQLTRRILIDLAAPLEETLQIETTMTLGNEDSKNIMRNKIN